jgi:hypothetical protein
MEVLLELVEASALAQTLRRSVWLYPFANVLHVLGVMAFFAAVAAMDVQALRSSNPADLRAFIGRLRPIAVLLLAMLVTTGLLLFLPEASHIAHNVAFQVKLAVIGLALFNVLALQKALTGAARAASIPGSVRLTALASLVLWLTVAALGRLIAYF